MAVVLKYPELREAPNSDGARIQPLPTIGGQQIIGCPSFPTQDEAALFLITLYAALGVHEPAWAYLVRQAWSGAGADPKLAARMLAIEKQAREFARSQNLGLPAPAASPNGAQGPGGAIPQAPASPPPPPPPAAPAQPAQPAATAGGQRAKK